MASTHTVQLYSEQGSSLPVSIEAQLQYGDGAKLQLKQDLLIFCDQGYRIDNYGRPV